jgi:hypothetical protein
MTPDDSSVEEMLRAVDLNRRRVRLVGVFIIGVAVAQVVLTIALALDGSSFGSALEFNPRLAWVLAASVISDRAGEVMSVVSALVSSAFGLALVRARTGALFLYLWAEGLFSAPVFMFLFVIVLVGIPHAYVPRAFFVPFGIFAATILAPWLACLWLYLKRVN